MSQPASIAVVLALSVASAPAAHADVIWSKCVEELSGGTLHSFRFAIGKDAQTAQHNRERVTRGQCEIALECGKGWYAQVVTHLVEGRNRSVAEGVACGARNQEEALELAQEGCFAAGGGSEKAACRTVLHLGLDDNSYGEELTASATEMTGGDYDRQGCLDQSGRMGHAVARGQFFECY